jgi:hypothetical protein
VTGVLAAATIGGFDMADDAFEFDFYFPPEKSMQHEAVAAFLEAFAEHLADADELLIEVSGKYEKKKKKKPKKPKKAKAVAQAAAGDEAAEDEDTGEEAAGDRAAADKAAAPKAATAKTTEDDDHVPVVYIRVCPGKRI